MKKILSLILFMALTSVIKADDSNWILHPIFDEEVSRVVETPTYIYFTSYQLQKNTTHEVYESLFRYDKKGEELVSLSKSNILNGNIVRKIEYNPSKGYLMVVYKDYNIDLLYNNGNVVNIPSYYQTNISHDKKVNSITIDRDHDRAFLATDFGYVAINDTKYEVAESRIYGEPLQAFARLGDRYLAIRGDELLQAPVDSPRLSLDQYDMISTFDQPYAIYPLKEDVCLLICGNPQKSTVKRIFFAEEDIEIEDILTDKIFNIENILTGVTIATGNMFYQLDKNGGMNGVERPEEYNNSAAASANLTEIWNGLSRKGLSSVKRSGSTWSVTRDWMLPNAPATFVSVSFANHPSLGLLMLQYGSVSSTTTANLISNNPFQLSAYDKGRWSNLAPAYTNPDRKNLLTGANGIAIDPDNNNYVYISSYHNGFARLNLKDPNDIIHFSYPGDPDKNNPGFVELPTHPVYIAGYANITAPYFDSKGNLWMSYADWDDRNDPNPHLYYWSAEDRKATTSASNVRFPKVVEFDVYAPVRNTSLAIPLLKTGNGMVVFAASDFNDRVLMLDTNGTPTDPKDDKVYDFKSFTDADGNSIDVRYTNYLWEDQATGNVWVCHQLGVFYFVPSQVKSGKYVVNRVKVARNDGTNLADYLLDGVSVNQVTADGDGRKWFATSGAGVICTSSDGREILEEFNKDNSLLPSDNVFGIGYNSSSNSLMISTDEGYAEYKLPATEANFSKEDVKAFPNPVRPEYSGFVTISDIPVGSFVKITDVKGNLVKDLGVMSGFEILWDISDINFNRVKSGVYHIMISPSNETSSYSAVGKILVIS